MSSPNNEMTALVPTSVVSKTRKNSRHLAPEERIARGPLTPGSMSPEAFRQMPLDETEAPTEQERSQRLKGKGKQPMLEDEVEFLAESKTERSGEDARRMSVVSVAMHEEASDDEGQDLCVICLQAVRDPTIVGECGHKIFCFECINVWANQSRKCPLCTRPMTPFLLHELDSPVGPIKFYLSPLPTIRPNPVTAPLPATRARRRLSDRPSGELGYSARDGLVGRRTDLWARVKLDSRGVAEEDLLERAVERRREVYRYGLYAKHIASNSFTRFKPCPTPCQFAESPDTIARATSFIRRELRVWRHLDVEFLTTYIVSLMKSIDIRSEPAVRLLADFLDERGSIGRGRRGAEQFAHEVYSFLRSPYRDLALYDAIAQYDPVPGNHSDSESDVESIPRHRQSSVEIRNCPSRVDGSRARSQSVHSEASSQSSASVRSISPPPMDKSRKRTKLSPRRWNRSDSYVVASHRPNSYGNGTHRESVGRRWNHRDSWVNDQVKRDDKRRREEKPVRAPKSEAVLIPERPAPVHRGMRGWGEVEQNDDITVMDVEPDSKPQPRAVDNSERQKPSEATPPMTETKSSLELRIFGVAGRAPQPDPTQVPSTGISYDSDWEDRALDSAIWTGADPIRSLKGVEKDVAPETAQVKEDSNDLGRNANRGRLLARLEREKKQQAKTPERSPAAVTAQDLTVTESTTANTQEETDSPTAEAEATAKARLQTQLKLRLEREKAASVAKASQAEKATNPVDRAAALRAKLLEKKLAASQAQRA